jgi:hypothetical protein
MASGTAAAVKPDLTGPQSNAQQLNMSADSGSDAPAAASIPAASIKVSVLGQATHLPPVAGPSPTQQIADRITAEVSSASNASSETAAGAAGSQAATSSVKILNLQLEPENLGRVTVQLRLTGTGLELQVQAASAETMRMIADDKDLLVGKLRASGYSVDALVVKAGELEVAPGQNGLGAGGDSTNQTSSQANPQTTSLGASLDGEPSGNDRSSTQGDRAQPQAPTLEQAQDVRAGRGAGGDLYI